MNASPLHYQAVPGGSTFWLFRQPQPPLGYGFPSNGLGAALRVAPDGVVWFAHPRSGMLPLARVHASRLTYYRAAFSLWGREELARVRDWWQENYSFCENKLATLLTVDSNLRVLYRGHYLGLVQGSTVSFTPVARAIYSMRQLALMSRQLAKIVD